MDRDISLQVAVTEALSMLRKEMAVVVVTGKEGKWGGVLSHESKSISNTTDGRRWFCPRGE